MLASLVYLNKLTGTASGNWGYWRYCFEHKQSWKSQRRVREIYWKSCVETLSCSQSNSRYLLRLLITLGEMRLLLSISDLRTSLCSLFMANVRIKKTMCTVNKKLSNAVYVIPFSVDTKSFVSQIYNLHILTWWLRKEWTKILFPIMSGRSHETKYSKMNQIKFVECSL